MAVAIGSSVFETDTAKQVLETAQRGMGSLADVRDDMASRVKRAPMTSMGIAFGGGVLLGAFVGFLTGHACSPSVAVTAREPLDEQC